MSTAAVLAVRSTTSGPESVVVGVVCIAVGLVLLALGGRLRNRYEAMMRGRGASSVAIMSAYVCPVIFVAFGVAALAVRFVV